MILRHSGDEFPSNTISKRGVSGTMSFPSPVKRLSPMFWRLKAHSREIANELAHGLLSSIRMCGKCAGTQYKTSLNQPKTHMLNAMFSRL
jgi:hypothetical protein